MAATLTDAGELTYLSFGIDKIESTPGGDLMCYGRASDGSLDHDDQIVDPQFSSKAIRDWLESGGNVRVQHNPQRDPAGVGLEVSTDADGGTWVKSLIVEPVAKKLLAAGALRAYSVGIAHPTIVRDPVAKGGRITQGSICEISLVDRPANARCGVTLVKSADSGAPEYIGEVFGAEADIAKALGADVTKGADDEFVNVDLPRGASISISPADFAKLHTFKQQLVTKTAGATTNPLDDSDSMSKGIVTDTAEKAAPYTGPVEPIQEALEKVAAERPDSVIVLPPALKEAEPDVTKNPEPEDAAPAAKKAKKPKGKKKLPPWLNKPADGDGDSDDGSCKQDHAHTEKCKTTPAEAAGLSGSHDMSAAPVPELLESPPVASMKSSPDPQSASGADEAESMDPAPSGELEETPPPASAKAGMMQSSPEVAAILRFKAAGMDIELGRIHDLTCPAYHPEDVAKCHPFADLSLIDVDAFQREAVKAACGPDLQRSRSLTKAWQAAGDLRKCDPAVLNDYRLEAHKAFRDANPGPASAPTPGMMAPGRYNRPLVTDGHEASSPGHDGPNSSPAVAASAPDAHSFDRPPLASGHQSPSPSHMKASFEYPDGTGRPQQLNYAQMDKERGRMALVEMHDHLSRQFPEVCPMDKPGSRPLRGVQPEHHPVPPVAGLGKSITPEPAATAAPVAASFKADPEDLGTFADAEVYKGFKKARKKLGKKVLSGKMTVDEARSRLGRQFTQKAAEPAAATIPATYVTPGDPNMTPTQVRELQGALQKMAGESVGKIIVLPPGTPEKGLTAAQVTEIVKGVQAGMPQPVLPVPAEPVTLEAANFGTDPDVIKAAVAEATAELKDLLVKQQETFTTKLAEQQRVIDAIADQPDPSTAAFSGLAFNPVRTKAARPAGVAAQAEIAERTQNMVIRNLQELYNSSSDPFEREGYYKTLSKMRGFSGQ